jgi:hypothetical protein
MAESDDEGKDDRVLQYVLPWEDSDDGLGLGTFGFISALDVKVDALGGISCVFGMIFSPRGDDVPGMG